MVTSTIRSATVPQSDGPPDFDELFAAEDRHFWFRARNRILARVVGQLVASLPAGYQVLEVGCGTGNVLRVLERVCSRGTVTGIDLFEGGLGYARQRTRCRVLAADIHELPFRRPFELIGMFDVLEHLPDDRRALRDLFQALAPGGRLVLTVPAHMALWSYADEWAQHFRRYGSAGLTRALEESGFQVDYLSQFMMVLGPLMWLSRRLAALMPRRGESRLQHNRTLMMRELRIVPGVNGLLNFLLGCEVPLLARRWRLPLGSSLLAIARKPLAA